MRRRVRDLLFLALTLIRPAAPRAALAVDPGSGRALGAPNILLIIGDDHAGGMLGIDGNPYRATPRLDALAREGVRFDRAYCNAPLCTPSRQSLITGKLPHAVGVSHLTSALPDDAVTLGDWLGGLGYATGAIGKMHFNNRHHHGFSERLDAANWERHLRREPPEGGDHRRPFRPFRDPSREWLNADCRPAGLPTSAMEASYFVEHASRFFRSHQREPFALVVGFHEPHAPFLFPEEWGGRYRPDQFPTYSLTAADRRDQPEPFAPLVDADVRGIQAAYYSSLSFLDHSVGRVLDALEVSGQAERTIVVYLGDNGYLLGQHGRFEKHCFFEQAVRVPLIVRWPGHLPADRRVEEMVELVDVLPTLLDLAHLPAPPDLHGRSLVPLLRGEPGATGRSLVFSEYLANEEAMVRSDRYKLIVGNGPARRREDGLDAAPHSAPFERLYDLQADPGETTDLAGNPSLAAVRDGLRAHLHERLVVTRAPRTPIPPGLTRDEAIRWCLVPRP